MLNCSCLQSGFFSDACQEESSEWRAQEKERVNIRVFHFFNIFEIENAWGRI